MIYASTARELTNKVRQENKNPFNVVDRMIRKAIKRGESYVTFRDSPNCQFPSKKETKEFFRSIGYEIESRKFKDGDYFEGNEYTIRW